MKSLRFFSIWMFILFAMFARSQTDPTLIDPILVRLKGRLVSASDSIPIPYANIINNRNRSGTTTNNEGYFTLDVLNIDSLIVSSVGYQKTVLYIPHHYMGYDIITFTMNPVSYAVEEVNVK